MASGTDMAMACKGRYELEGTLALKNAWVEVDTFLLKDAMTEGTLETKMEGRQRMKDCSSESEVTACFLLPTTSSFHSANEYLK